MLAKREIIKTIEKLVKEELKFDCTGHDWWHVDRVRRLALLIANKEGKCDLFKIELMTLLHDIDDWKFRKDSKGAQSKNKKIEWLKELHLEEELIQAINSDIEKASFKGNKNVNAALSLEGQILQDADRLDAIGAIGIARTFAYGGFKNRPLFDPNIACKDFKNVQAYQEHRGTTINHFYEKLLLIKNLLNTKTAKMIAEERHKFMEDFLKQFYKETQLKSTIDA